MVNTYHPSPSVKSLDICPNSSLKLKEKTKKIPFKEDTTSLTPRKVQQALKEMY
jgi:hypothetical protein